MKGKKMKRILSVFLCLLLVFPYGTMQVLAAEAVLSNNQAVAKVESSLAKEGRDQSFRDITGAQGESLGDTAGDNEYFEDTGDEDNGSLEITPDEDDPSLLDRPDPDNSSLGNPEHEDDDSLGNRPDSDDGSLGNPAHEDDNSLRDTTDSDDDSFTDTTDEDDEPLGDTTDAGHKTPGGIPGIPVKETDKKLSDTTRHIDISGTTHIDTEDVTSALPSIKTRGIGVSGGSQVTGVGEITYDFLNTSLNDNFCLNGSVGIQISSIEYRLKMDVGLLETRIDDLYLNVTSKVSMSAGLAMDLQEAGEAGELELGSVPFRMGNSGLSGELIFWLVYDAYGNASISYNLESSTGVEYRNGQLQPFAHNKSTLHADVNSEFTLGPRMQLVLHFDDDILLFDITVDLGISGKADASLDLEHGQYHLDCFVYLSMYAGEDSLIGGILELKRNVIWDYNTSPFHLIMDSGLQP